MSSKKRSKRRTKTAVQGAPSPSRDEAGRKRRDYYPWLIVLLFVLFGVTFGFLGTFSFAQRIVGVDPVGYYAWIHSLAFDRDLDFENEYRTLNGGRVIPGDTLVNPDGPRTVTGHLPNAFSLGPGLLWSPFLLPAHLLAKVGGVPADGFSPPYHAAVFLVNIVYALLGALLTYYALRTWFEPMPSYLATISAWAASPALYYTYAQEAMSHAGSFFSVALLLYLWARLREKESYLAWAAIGAATGLATLVRWQDVSLALVPAVDLLRRRTRPDFQRLVVCGTTSVLVFLPQMVGWKILYGSFLTIPQGAGFMNWMQPNPLKLLFSAEHGLITWTPLCAVGVIGLFVWSKEQRWIFLPLAVALVAQLYIGSCAGNVGWSFGMRRMVSCVPLFAAGTVLIVTQLHWRTLWTATICGAFVWWNFLSVLQYGGLLDRYYIEQAVVQLAEEQEMNPQTLLTARQLRDGTPFSFPQFAQSHRFPKGAGPSFGQFVTDKPRVLAEIFRRLFVPSPDR